MVPIAFPTPSSPTTRLFRSETVWNMTNGECWYCGEALERDSFHIEQIEPRTLGGSDELDNLVPSCPACNFRKSKYPVEEFRERKIERGNLSSDRRWIFPPQGKPKFHSERRRKK